MQHTIIKNGVTIKIEQNAINQYGTLSVIAHFDGQSQWGTIPGDYSRVYPRIEFKFTAKARWLHNLADRRWWSVDDDDYESKDDIDRPTDHCDFLLSEAEAKFLAGWRIMPERERPERVAEPVHQEFGIGRIGDADPATEALAGLEAIEITKRQNAGKPKRTVKLCDCGHRSAWPMSTSSGSSCPDCYDRMSL